MLFGLWTFYALFTLCCCIFCIFCVFWRVVRSLNLSIFSVFYYIRWLSFVIINYHPFIVLKRMSFGNLFVFSLGGVAGGLSPECGLVREEELGCWNCIKKIDKNWWAGRMGREYSGHCARCYAGISWCCLSRYYSSFPSFYKFILARQWALTVTICSSWPSPAAPIFLIFTQPIEIFTHPCATGTQQFLQITTTRLMQLTQCI